MTTSDPYSASRVSRGVAYLLGGKIVTSVAGVGTFLLLVRSLPIEQFAAYSVLFALVELVDAITGVGLTQVLSRYVPELLVGHRHKSLRGLLAVTLALRGIVLAVFLGLIYLVAPIVSPLIGLADWEWAVRAYLAVVLVRVAAATLFTVLESMLHQAIAQTGAALVTVMRFALLALAAGQGALDLQTVIAIELVTDLIGCTVMLFGMLRAVPSKVAGEPEVGDWIRSNGVRMFEFGIKGYLQHMLIMPYGGATNRLLVGGALGSPEVALFGFAQSVADLMERYLPVKLLAGVIRPVLTARYARSGRFSDLRFTANLIFKTNATLVCLAAVVIYAGGEDMVTFIAAGKYRDGGVELLLLMCALVFMYSLRLMLDHVSHAVERNGPLIWSNAVITSSVLLGIGLLPVLGVYALPAANLFGLAVGIAVLVWRLRAAGFDYRYDVAGLVAMSVATTVGIGVGQCSRLLDLGWIGAIAAAAVTFVCALLALKPFSHEERQLLVRLIRR